METVFFTKRVVPETFYVKESNGTYKVAEKERVIKAALKILQTNFSKSSALTNPRKVKELLSIYLTNQTKEFFVILWLDAKHQPLRMETLFEGSINGARIYNREIIKSALSCNAHAAILAHNHPSGTTLPSDDDRMVTKSIQKALEAIDVSVLDHFVVGRDILSFAENNLL